jgi:O-antigen ligase
MILAFMPLVPRAGVLSLDASPSRLMELGLLALALIAALVLAPPARLIEIASRNAGLSLVIGTFAIWAALTSVFAGKSPTGIVKAAELLAIVLVAYAGKADPNLRPASTPRIVALAVVGATLLLLAANIPIYGELLPMLPTEGEYRVRLMLGFNHPLASALLLAIGMVAVLFARLPVLVLVAYETALGTLFVLCNARGLTLAAMLAVIAAICVYARPAPRAALTLVLLLAGAAISIYLSLQEGFAARFMALAGDDATLNGRTELWSLVLRVASEHLLSGVGYFNLRYHVIDTFSWSGSAHNSFFEVLAGTGILGAALFLFFLFIWFGRTISLRDGFLIALSPILLIESMLNSILFMPGFAFFVLMMALARPLPAGSCDTALAAAAPARKLRRPQLSPT